MKNEFYKIQFDNVISQFPNTYVTRVKEAAQNGVSSWLICLPLEEHGFILNKKEFSYAIQHHLEGPPQALWMWQAKRQQPHDYMSERWIRSPSAQPNSRHLSQTPV